MRTAHIDRFVIDRLPPAEALPEFRLDAPHLAYPDMLNAAEALLGGGGAKDVVLRWPGGCWTYGELQAVTNQACGVLRGLGLQPGGRVLLRGFNGPMLCALWLAVVKVGGVVVTTMPMLRARELDFILRKTQPAICLVEQELEAELAQVVAQSGLGGRSLDYTYAGGGDAAFDHAMAGQPQSAAPTATYASDPALIAFTSGTTGDPKATVHSHRDLLAIADSFPRFVLGVRASDIFLCSAPMGFTYGLGGHLVFPLRHGASSLLLPAATPDKLFDAMVEHRPTIVMTAPTAYRAMTGRACATPLRHVRRFVSAGEHLPAAAWRGWNEATGSSIVNGIGSTEMLHIFVSTTPDRQQPGATGTAVKGYQAAVLDADLRPAAPGEVGQLAVKGPTGCRYLDDPRQARYVRGGWNITGDAYSVDDEGVFWFESRADDMIVSSGYNISGREVEESVLRHEAVLECAVVAAPDEDRGAVVKAYVVATPGRPADAALARSIQDFVKGDIAPFKYPRAVEFVDALPRNASGKLQRFVLRDRAKTGLQPAGGARPDEPSR